MNSDRPDRGFPDLLFVVGCPRSGTTWLQLLLDRHPAVSTVNETHLFSNFLGPALGSWDDLERSDREIGLGAICDRREFVERLRSLAREVLGRIAGADTELIVEKTPGHALWGEEILEIFPEALMAHLVRDPRDVAASLLAAGRGWGEYWAPDNAYDAAWWWKDHVTAGRSIDDLTDGYHELTYEDLHADPAGELARILRWAGLDAPEPVLRAAVEETHLPRMKKGETPAPWDLTKEPDGFVRKGGTGNWRDDLTRSEARILEHVTRDVMRDLGYRPEGRGGLPPPALIRYWLRDRVRERLA